jgi:hypothetical protein
MRRCASVVIETDADKTKCTNEPEIQLLEMTLKKPTNWLLFASASILANFIFCALLCPFPHLPRKRRCSKIKTSLAEHLDRRQNLAR